MFAVSKLASSTIRMSGYALRGLATRAENPLVFMDFAAGGKDVGRIVFEVGDGINEFFLASC